MIFHKTIVINVNFKVNDFKQTYLALCSLVHLFADIEFIFALEENEIARFKEKLIHFENVKLIIRDYKATNLSIEKKDMTCSSKAITSQVNDGCEVTSGAYWFNDQLVDASDFIKLVGTNKKIVYYLGESNYSYYRKNTFSDLYNKLVDDLSDLKTLRNVIIVYKPMFSYEKTKLNLTNQRIDEVVQLIRNFSKNYFNEQCQIVYGANVNADNVLSFCVTNNLDGFCFDWNQENIDDLLVFVHKIYMWQRIIINQARRRII